MVFSDFGFRPSFGLRIWRNEQGGVEDSLMRAVIGCVKLAPMMVLLLKLALAIGFGMVILALL